MKKAGFDSLESGDIIYKVVENKSNSDLSDIIEVVVKSINIIRTEKIDVGDRWEIDIRDFSVYKVNLVLIENEEETTLCVNLTDSDIYKFNFAGYYVYKDDAIKSIKDFYSRHIEYLRKLIITTKDSLKIYEEALSKL